MQWEITKQVLAAAIRWMLASIGLWLVKKGIVDQQLADAWLNEVTATLLGLLVLSIPLIWKYLNARFNILALIAAVQRHPPADTASEVRLAVADVKAEVKANNTVSSV
jgi:hypothetical protein